MRLEPLSDDAFEAFAQRSLTGFVDQQVASGLSAEPEAARQARRAFADLLPDGLATAGHLVWTVRAADGPAVGHLWARVHPGAGEVGAYVVDIDLDASARGRGLGRAAMLAAEDAVRRRGATVVRLNVFAHNAAALRLYDGLGYTVADVLLTRRLDGPGGPRPAQHVVLRDMTAEQYADLRSALHDRVADLDDLLPDGVATMGHRLWTAYDGRDPVARVWVQLQHRADRIHAHVHHLAVHEEAGVGRYREATVLAVTQECRQLGAGSAGVRVRWGDDQVRAVYAASGFRLTAQTREKSL